MILGEKIMSLRKRMGWSQEELAHELGVSRQSVSKWESSASIPDIQKIIALGSLFGVSTDYLLRDELDEPVAAIAVDAEKQDAVFAQADVSSASSTTDEACDKATTRPTHFVTLDEAQAFWKLRNGCLDRLRLVYFCALQAPRYLWLYCHWATNI